MIHRVVLALYVLAWTAFASPLSSLRPDASMPSVPTQLPSAETPHAQSTPKPSKPPQSAPTAAQLAEATWIEGRVVVPEGTPKDEKLAVFADASGSADFDKHRVDVALDGSFKVAFAKNVKRGRLRLAARYLYVEKDFAWKTGDATIGIALAPTIGSVIQGRLLLPAGLDDATKEIVRAEVVGKSVKIEGTPSSPGRNAITRSGEIRADMTYELGGLPAGYEYALTLLVDTLVPHEAEALSVQPGSALVHDIALMRGATIRGVVVDERGDPVADALIGVVPSGSPLALPPKDMLDSLRSGLDGTFVMRGVAAGTANMFATKSGHTTVNIDVPNLKEGEVREGVRIPLNEGRVLRGKALFADGKPAAGAKVHASQPQDATHAPYVLDVVADSEGAFRITGFEDAPVKLTATLEVRALNSADDKSTKASDAKQKRVTYRAAAVDFASTAGEVTLTLELGIAIEGHVLDDSGRLVQSFKAGAMRADSIASMPSPGSHVTRDVRSADGSFALDGLTKGDWYVYVYAKSLAYPVAQRVTIPHTGAPLVFVMSRTASVSGVVLDEDQKPIVGVIVKGAWFRPAIFGNGETGEATEVKSGKDGHFELTDVYPGAVTVSARRGEKNDGPAVPVTLKPGEVRANIELRYFR